MKIPVNNTNLAYDDHGIGLPIIFLHAFPLNRSMWQSELITLLSDERYRLVALDWHGFGESEITNPISTMELFADDLAGLMDSLGIQQAVLCGLSMGGYAAFAFLRKYSQRVSGLILAGTRPGADTPEAQANRENVARIAETQGTGVCSENPRRAARRHYKCGAFVQPGAARGISTSGTRVLGVVLRKEIGHLD